MSQTVRSVILGASGYTGAELLRLLAHHPYVELAALSGESQAGKPVGEVYAHLRHLPQTLKPIGDIDFSDVQAVFCCLPHGTTQSVIAALPGHVKVVDLSADFRLSDIAAYKTWYGHEHQAATLQKEAVYGLTEHYREQVRQARLVANPGCYPTSILNPLIPLLRTGMIDPANIISDSKSGVTGAGRSAKQAYLYTELSEGISAYGIGGHRHCSEIDQELSIAAGSGVNIRFTPHLMPMNRGILSTIYVTLTGKTTPHDVRAALQKRYADERFITVLPEGPPPSTHQVRGTNCQLISVHADRAQGRAVIISVIDNLVKGASGQAIQNFNVMFGFEESTALTQTAVFP